MKKGTKLAKNCTRISKAREFWLNVAADFQAGMNPIAITQKYTNPRTQKPYNLNHIYWILHQLQLL